MDGVLTGVTRNYQIPPELIIDETTHRSATSIRVPSLICAKEG